MSGGALFTGETIVASILLSALPAHHEAETGRCYRSTVIEIMGEILGRQQAEAKTLEQVRALVRRFGEDVANRHPERSFIISVGAAKGSRKPAGFDAANRSRELGQEAWVKTITLPDRLEPGAAA